MAGPAGSNGGRTGSGASLLRIPAHLDWIAVVGITLAVTGSVALDLTGAADGVESFLACLMGITIALVVDTGARAERRFRIRSMLDAAPWLGRTLVPILQSTADIERDHPDTLVAAEARLRYRALAGELNELRRGRIVRPRGDYEHLLAATRTCSRAMVAVADVTPDRRRGLGWWTGDIGQRYWRLNLEALARNVQITRVFVYTEMTAELRKLVATQRRAGVTVGLVQAETLDPQLRFNLAIWDDSCAWEGRLNVGGEIVGNVYTINDDDLDRLRRVFERCGMAAGLRGEDERVGSPG